MGTRASFWIGNPEDVESRQWLGCIAWDGYPDDEEMERIGRAQTPEEFAGGVETHLHGRNDFSHPENGWPFPWDDDIFITDFTYAFFDRKVHWCCFHGPWYTVWGHQIPDREGDEDERPSNVPAPKKYNPEQPDSIMFLRAK